VRLQARTETVYFYFAARAFDQPDVGTFTIGPVTFYRRNDWLGSVENLEGRPYSWKTDVLKRWTNRQGHLKQILNPLGGWVTGKAVTHWADSRLTRNLLRLRERANYVDEIVKAVGACEWVIAVPIEGRDPSRSWECASVAALVALDSLGLSMPAGTARGLRGPGDERQAHVDHDLNQRPGKPLSFSISMDLPRLAGPPGAQAKLLSDTAPLRDSVGSAITAFVNVTNTSGAPILLQRWLKQCTGLARHGVIETSSLLL
jgi:hypothetical protein